VLLDDDFTVLPRVVAEGRRVLANIERVANLFLTKTVYSIVLALLVGVAHVPFPFLRRHITLVATLTIGVPGFLLALAPSNERARPGFVPFRHPGRPRLRGYHVRCVRLSPEPTPPPASTPTVPRQP
jgi:cation-transporting ATPase E